MVAIVPARGGTDPVPYLNIKRLGDGPLLAHTLAAARDSATIDRVVVSTDDERVAAVARAHGGEVPFLRPRELAADQPSLMPVVAHAVRTLEAAGERIDVVVILQATTPFRDASAIDQAVERLFEGGFDSVVSVTEDRTLNWREDKGVLVPLFAREGRREEQIPIYKENGAVVALRRAVIDSPLRFGEKVGWLVLDKRAGFTVHDLEDFWMAERLLRQPRVLFRVDGSASVGMGHVFRALAIAEALRSLSRADIAFLMSADHTEGLVTVSRAGYAVRVVGDGRQETYLEHIRDFSPAILINDLPALDGSYLTALSHLRRVPRAGPARRPSVASASADRFRDAGPPSLIPCNLFKQTLENPSTCPGGPRSAPPHRESGGRLAQAPRLPHCGAPVETRFAPAAVLNTPLCFEGALTLGSFETVNSTTVTDTSAQRSHRN